MRLFAPSLLLLGLALAGCSAQGTAAVVATPQGGTTSPQASAPAATAKPSTAPASTAPTTSPKPSASPVVLPSPWPSGFPTKNASALPTTAPTSLDGTLWGEVPGDQAGATKLKACEGTYLRFAFQDPGKDGKDVLLAIDEQVATGMGRFGPTNGKFVGNKVGDEWVFRGEITAPGPADAPETKPWTFRLKAQAGPALVGTAARADEEEAASKRDVKLVPVEGGPCPTPKP